MAIYFSNAKYLLHHIDMSNTMLDVLNYDKTREITSLKPKHCQSGRRQLGKKLGTRCLPISSSPVLIYPPGQRTRFRQPSFLQRHQSEPLPTSPTVAAADRLFFPRVSDALFCAMGRFTHRKPVLPLPGPRFPVDRERHTRVFDPGLRHHRRGTHIPKPDPRRPVRCLLLGLRDVEERRQLRHLRHASQLRAGLRAHEGMPSPIRSSPSLQTLTS